MPLPFGDVAVCLTQHGHRMTVPVARGCRRHESFNYVREPTLYKS